MGLVFTSEFSVLSFQFRRRRHWLLSAFMFVLASAWTVAGTSAVAPGDELPDGEGKKILQTACTSCHDLGEVTKFRGYYTRAQWRDVVVTMADYGAEIQPAQIDILADYLEQHLGRR
jgi:mono/diheme cytochrome c family protein